jgi:hypothetical protein
MFVASSSSSIASLSSSNEAVGGSLYSSIGGVVFVNSRCSWMAVRKCLVTSLWLITFLKYECEGLWGYGRRHEKRVRR